ncbi:gelsolin [Diplocarpon rosae]|nr:gelsolin [Diplocarpon rosae]
MSTQSTADSSEDVNDFLQRIKELGDRRDQEDEERNRKLEQEILQGRAERQARRAERARSISPTKSSPAGTPIASRAAVTPTSTAFQAQSPRIETKTDPEPQREMAVVDAMDRLTGSTSPLKENTSDSDTERAVTEPESKRTVPIKPSPSSAVPSRNSGSPLSWQRRPISQSSDRAQSRPLSMVATENAARSPRAAPAAELSPTTEPTLSKDQITQSLAAKDPAWFRQTADRGLTSPAYRRNQVEDENRSDHGSNSPHAQLPGMSRQFSEPDKVVDEPVDRSVSPSRSSVSYGSGSRFSYQASPKLPGLGSPMPLTAAHRLDPPSDSKSEGRALAMSPTQGRISPDRLDRPPSPTKGMGGFVQSAMMKRSDSVNKRWSVQSPSGLTRGNSVASNRSSVDPATGSSMGNVVNATAREPTLSSLSRDTSPRPTSRPSSSHSNSTLTQERPGTSSSMRSNMTTSTSNDGFVKPALPASRIQTSAGVRTRQTDDSETPARRDITPPSSPTKTMDSRRWSPTKSSWLESALNKPDSPKPRAALPQQPSWMSEINKAKQKGSFDLGRRPSAAPKHEVNIGGLMRSPPPGGIVKPLSISGLSAGFSSGAAKPEVTSPEAKDSPKPIDTTDALSKLSPTDDKAKPNTPPKKDFRAGLKARPQPSDNGGSNEPEFKNVFGQLRRTKTQNYVAPDELKNNITRGKAALNLTAGPKKTERVDEFKDAILKKKDDFKKAQSEGKGVTRSISGGSQDAPLPEALAKRRALGRSDSILSEPASGGLESPSGTRIAPDSPKPGFVKELSIPGRLQAKENPAGKLAGRLNPSLAGLLARGPPSIASESSRSSSPAQSLRTASISTSTSQPAEPGPQLTHMTKGRARGPRRKAPTSTPTPTPSNPSSDLAEKPTIAKQEISKKPPPLEVETMPQVLERAQSPTKTPGHIRSPSKVLDRFPQSPTKVDENSVSQPSSPRKLDMKRRSQFLQDVANKNSATDLQLESPKPLSPTNKANDPEISVKSQEPSPKTQQASSPKPKPSTPVKSPALSKYPEPSPVTSPIDPPENAKLEPLPLSPRKTTTIEQQPLLPSPTEQKASASSVPASAGEVDREPVSSFTNATSLWNRPSAVSAEKPSPRARSPIKLPTHEDEKAAMVSAGLRSPSPVKAPVGPGLQKSTAAPRGARPLPTLPPKNTVSPKESVLSAVPDSGPRSPGLSKNSLDLSVPQASEASQLLGEFFGDNRPQANFSVDTAALLTSRPESGGNIKTLRSALYQFSNDGKKQQVPSHQDRILFEGNLYLCTHTFGNAAGKKSTQAYFWIGDSVPDTVVDDIEVFAQREAKIAGGKLIKIRQGRETPEFFLALDGIIIIRRGSSNKYDSLAPHILCARKHFGQIAFDEVDFSPASLCSGFPYLICTQSGKAYLWKGKGSGIDELGCARLIGSDSGLTGEIEEVEDGSEPASFLQIFGNGVDIPKSADHWRMKPNYNKYCGRLFVADSAAKEQIVEVSPFCQSDLDASKIYVLDAFFEIYIIVGSRSQSQYLAFQNSLMFAQEYGILAAGMEDRPFVPVSTVVLEGVPKDMKSVFRKWVEGLSITLHKPAAGGLQRGRSLRVVPLTAALEATRN